MRRSVGEISVSISKELMSFWTTEKRKSLSIRPSSSAGQVGQGGGGRRREDLGGEAVGPAVREGVLGRVAEVPVADGPGERGVQQRAVGPGEIDVVAAAGEGGDAVQDAPLPPAGGPLHPDYAEGRRGLESLVREKDDVGDVGESADPRDGGRDGVRAVRERLESGRGQAAGEKNGECFHIP